MLSIIKSNKKYQRFKGVRSHLDESNIHVICHKIDRRFTPNGAANLKTNLRSRLFMKQAAMYINVYAIFFRTIRLVTWDAGYHRVRKIGGDSKVSIRCTVREFPRDLWCRLVTRAKRDSRVLFPSQRCQSCIFVFNVKRPCLRHQKRTIIMGEGFFRDGSPELREKRHNACQELSAVRSFSGLFGARADSRETHSQI